MHEAFAQQRDVRTSDNTAAIRRSVPLSRAQREVIGRLRAWLRDGRAQSASFAEAAAAERSQVRLELDASNGRLEAGVWKPDDEEPDDQG